LPCSASIFTSRCINPGKGKALSGFDYQGEVMLGEAAGNQLFREDFWKSI